MHMFQAEILSGKPVTSVAQARDVCAMFTEERGVATVIVTLGSEGAVIGQRGSQDTQHVQCKKVKVIDSTVSLFSKYS